MKLFITGGSVFVSKYTADYFVRKGYDVTVCNRGSKAQVAGTRLICADRHHLHEQLKEEHFDAVIDVCAYKGEDVTDLLDALPDVQTYILLSSSAVYPETNEQPFAEEQPLGYNRIWGDYGLGKIAAEQALLAQRKDAYILRPPYLYGPMQNLYREPFVFECVQQHLPFYIPDDGKMKLQFFYIEDLCKMMEAILIQQPQTHIFNVGNPASVDINTYVERCYQVVGEPLQKIYIQNYPEQRDYFSFYPYEYALDVTRQQYLLPQVVSLKQGLQASYAWYQKHPEDVKRKNYLEFIATHFHPDTGSN